MFFWFVVPSDMYSFKVCLKKQQIFEDLFLPYSTQINPLKEICN